MHKEEGLSFKDVVTFNLDEYYPMKKGTPVLSACRTHLALYSVASRPRNSFWTSTSIRLTFRCSLWAEFAG